MTFSLLDEILAMILGSQPSSSLSSTNEECEHDKNNLEQIYQEHQDIKKQWLLYFGRLPSSSVSNNSDSSQKDTPNTATTTIEKKDDNEEDIIPLKEQQTTVPDCWEDEADNIAEELSSIHLDYKSNSNNNNI